MLIGLNKCIFFVSDNPVRHLTLIDLHDKMYLNNVFDWRLNAVLKLISGGTHSEREKMFVSLIKQAAEMNDDILVLIPDQFSFEYDKKLYSALGAKVFNKIQTVGFNRLAELMAKKYGRNSKKDADNNDRIIAMYKAVKRLKATGNIKFYERSLKKSSFINDAINLISEFVQSGITPEDLRLASEKSSGSLQIKLFDLSRIFYFYLDELDKLGLKDSLTALGECCELAEKNKFFKGKSIFIDSFTDFSVDEINLIECMLKQSLQITISLIFSHENKARLYQSPFAETIRTAQNIKNLAVSKNIIVEEYKVKTDKNNCSAEIIHIDENLYSTSPVKSNQTDNIKIVSGTDVYEETEYICSEISRLVREEGYRYKDIAILLGNIQEISPILEGTFERYEIPYFIDCSRNAGRSALVLYLKSIFDCVVSRKWSTEKILKYIKSPLSDFLDYDICDIENYCITWNVDGDMWDSEFTAPADEGSSLKRINETRRSIIFPLYDFKKTCLNATAKDICLALYKMLDEINLSQQMFSKIKTASSDKEKDFELAREFKQLWKTVLSAITAIYTRFDNEKMSLREFSDIFALMISEMTVSKPPQTVDCIRIASTDHSRLSDVKVAFVIEANNGIFPADISNNGLLTYNDKKSLEQLNLNMSSNIMKQIEGERLNVYLALTMPEDKLYITYSESDFQGSLKRPSVIVSMIKRMFGNIETKIQDMPIDFFCTSYRTAFYKYLEKSSDKDAITASVGESLKESDIYKLKLDFVNAVSKKQKHELTSKMAEKLFFNREMNLSATRVKDYYSCPFSYYCKYGLKLKSPSAVEINPMNTGNLIHSCFEKIMSVKDENGKSTYDVNFIKLSDDVIKNRIHEEFIKYTNEFLGGNFGKTSSFVEAMKRLENSAFFAVKNIQTEFMDSLFVPRAFEYNLTKDNGKSILQLKLDDDIKINIRGSIDRADIYKAENGEQYIRIVDYKTGDTTLRLEELYNGLNLQMLIYLLAVTQRENDLNHSGDLKPSAILYSHINFVKAGFTPDEIEQLKKGDDLDEELVIKRASTYKPDGMMVENEFTFKALNKRFSGVFTPFKFTSKGEISGNSKKPVTEEYFIGLEQFALMKLYEMASKLKCGEIFADPIETSKSLACTYCEYWSICGNSSPKNPRKTDKSDIDKLNQEIENIIKPK